MLSERKAGNTRKAEPHHRGLPYLQMECLCVSALHGSGLQQSRVHAAKLLLSHVRSNGTVHGLDLHHNTFCSSGTRTAGHKVRQTLALLQQHCLNLVMPGVGASGSHEVHAHKVIFLCQCASMEQKGQY